MGTGTHLHMVRILLLLLAATVDAHNWINHPSRAVKVSTAKPCPQRSILQQTHVQANPGQRVQVEWATGHSGSDGSFVLVDAEDEHMLTQYSDQVRDEYLENATSTQLMDSYQVSMRAQDLSSTKQDGKNSCLQNGQSFEKEVTRKEALNRPLGFRTLLKEPGMETFWKFNQEIPEECRQPKYAAYHSEKYPWIKAILAYKITVHLPQDAQISEFPIPNDLVSKKYILHWYWRGYFDCTDVNVVKKSKPVIDNWGTNVGDPVFIRMDHCAFWDVSRWCKDGDNCGSGHWEGMEIKAKEAENAAKQLPKLQRAAIKPANGLAKQVEQRGAAFEALQVAQDADTAAKVKQTEASAAYNAAKATYSKTRDVADMAAREEAKVLKESAAAEKSKTYTALKTAQSKYKKTQDSWKKAVKANDAAQRDVRAMNNTWANAIHTTEWGTDSPGCVVIPAGSDNMTECQSTVCAGSKGECKLQVIPIFKPTTSLFGDAMIPTACQSHSNLVNAVLKQGDRLCYKIKEGNPNDSGSAYDVSADPEDPVFFSTCYRKQTSPDIQFEGNVCGDTSGDPCLLDTASLAAPTWRFQDRCLSCDDAVKNQQNDTTFNLLPTWTLQDECKRC